MGEMVCVVRDHACGRQNLRSPMVAGYGGYDLGPRQMLEPKLQGAKPRAANAIATIYLMQSKSAEQN